MLQIGFYLLLAVVFTMLIWGFNKAAVSAGYTNEQRKKWTKDVVLTLAGWLGYIYIIDATDVLNNFFFPPRMPLLLIIPAFIFLGWFFTAKRFKKIIDGFPMQLTVYYQTFRIFVELLILGVAIEGLGPYLATFEGRNFEIFAGLTAPIVGYLAYSKRVLPPKVVIAWNIAGLLLLANIVFIFVSCVVVPEFWGFTAPPFKMEFMDTPYIFIGSVFMPSAVFMHILSIKKSLTAIKQYNTV